MIKIYTSIFLVLISLLIAEAQYKYDYRIKLNDKASTYSESESPLPDSAQLGMVRFNLENSKEEKLNFINIAVKNKKTNSIFKTDSTGKAVFNLIPGTYNISVTGTGYNPVFLKDIIVTNKNSTKFSLTLGETSEQKTAKLRCSKKLSDKQIEGILRDITNGKMDSELIKCRICFLSFE